MYISKSFIQRVIMGTLLAGIMAVVIAFSHRPYLQIPFFLMMALFTGLSLLEYSQMAERKKVPPNRSWMLSLSLLYLLVIALTHHTLLGVYLPSVVLFLVLVTPFLHSFKGQEEPLFTIATSLFGFVWLTIPLSTMYLVNYYFPEGTWMAGPWWLFYLLAVAKSTDTLAYIVGKRLGKNPLAPQISPKKTVEGSLGGLLGAVLVSLLFSGFAPIDLSLLEALFLGLALGVLAQLGDLSESLIKRDVGVKDSNSIPGLGGILDVLDSLLFASPFLYLYLMYKWPEYAL